MSCHVRSLEATAASADWSFYLIAIILEILLIWKHYEIKRIFNYTGDGELLVKIYVSENDPEF